MQRLARVVLDRVLPVVVFVRSVCRRIVRPVKIGVRAIVVKDGRVLLVRQHGQSFWVLPGGSAGRGESLRTAAVREVREETGCVVRTDYLLGIYSGVYEGMTNHLALFVCLAMSEPVNKLSLEIAEAKYWPLDALPRTEGEVAERLSEYAAGQRGLATEL